jgi:hypothetical protein
VSIERYPHIRCDRCKLSDCVTYLGDLPVRILRAIMRDRGWTRVREGRKTMDYCPLCSGVLEPAPRTLEDAMHEEILAAVRLR